MTRITSFLGVVRVFLLRILSIVNPIAKVLGIAGLGFILGRGITKATGVADEDSKAVDFFSKFFSRFQEFSIEPTRFAAKNSMERFAKSRELSNSTSNTTNNSGGNTFIDQRQFNLDGQDAVDAVNELQTGPMQLN